MNENVRIAPLKALAVAAASPPAGSDFADSRAAQDAERQARYRLVIEEGPQSGTFIYKTMDRVTGEVIRQLPREQVLHLLETDQYDAGAVIDTKA